MRDPWKIAFPMLVEPWSKTPCLVFMAQPIKPADNTPVTMMQCIGMARNGQHYSFVVSIAAFEIASRAPVNFLETDDIIAPRPRILTSI